MEVYKPEIKKFLGKDVRIITVGLNQYIILKDMFEVLGRVKEDGQVQTTDRNKLHKFLKDIDKLCDSEELMVTSKSKKSKSRETQTVGCLLLETVPIVLTQFKPINSNRRSAEDNKRVLNEWYKFAEWIDNLIDNARNIVQTIENTTFQGDIDNLVISKDGVPITTSKVIAEVTGKEHFHILRDIREEISKLKEIHSPNLDSEIIINDFKETTYLAENGQIYIQYELGEMATMQLMLKYSTEYRAKFILAFQKMKTAIMNMFKAKVLDDVLPQNNKLRQYIYVIKNPLNETVKIGVAQDVDKRIKQLQTGAGIELELIYKSMICSNAFAIEKDVHKYFEEYRTFGEWFKINPEVVVDFLEKQDFILKSEYMKYLSI